ncbi:aminotransferase [Penicillium cosmopolitanum]|uniref:Aminotransferase n=1 Tax=Penicillium cosmopolitanum TaxID=1131564 RepID=A0A9W9VME3_9EURO|nr:aminotransferase [Penicillium cosmopolitanum]KAJ5385784.1 aminotransferase [Penicillium cosmopolitanum]
MAATDKIVSEMASWMKSQKLVAPQMKDAPVFYRNLEEALDVRRSTQSMLTRGQNTWKDGGAIDLCSNDLLSLGRTGELRAEFLSELAKYPDFALHSGGSRVMGGNYDYIEEVEQEIADFLGAETALMFNSGSNGNVAIYTSIPRPGDAIVYDELVHFSTHTGMASSLATTKVSFRHNDLDAFREAMISTMDSQPMIQDGSRSILVSIESVYSMDGDVCPLVEMLEIAREICPKKNFAFIADEAHATGIVGPKGVGLVKHLGLEKDIAIRLNTCGKALACTGSVVLGSATVRNTMLNFAGSLVNTTAPSFPSVAVVRSAYNLMRTGATQKAQDNVQHLVRYFFKSMNSHPLWDEATDMGLLSIPIIDESEENDFVTHIIPIWTRQKYNWWLFFHLQLAKIAVVPIDYPQVPKGKARLRVMIHATNTETEVDYLCSTIYNFVKEMMDIEESGEKGKIPKAAQQIYALMAANA